MGQFLSTRDKTFAVAWELHHPQGVQTLVLGERSGFETFFRSPGDLDAAGSYVQGTLGTCFETKHPRKMIIRKQISPPSNSHISSPVALYSSAATRADEPSINITIQVPVSTPINQSTS